MVNHLETVLLNEGRAAFPSGLPWYFDQGYTGPVPVPRNLSRAYEFLIPPDIGLDGRCERVKAVCGIVRGLVDMRPYVEMLDRRTTIPYAGNKSIRDLYRSLGEVPGGGLDMPGFVSKAVVAGGLAAHKGVDAVDRAIDGLSLMLKSGYEATTRFASGVVLMVMQLDPGFPGREG